MVGCFDDTLACIISVGAILISKSHLLHLHSTAFLSFSFFLSFLCERVHGWSASSGMLVIPMKEKKKGGVGYGRSNYCTMKHAKPRLDGLA